MIEDHDCWWRRWWFFKYFSRRRSFKLIYRNESLIVGYFALFFWEWNTNTITLSFLTILNSLLLLATTGHTSLTEALPYYSTALFCTKIPALDFIDYSFHAQGKLPVCIPSALPLRSLCSLLSHVVVPMLKI